MPKIYVDENGILRTNNNGILYRPFEYIYEDSNGYLRFRESDDLVHREVAYKYIYKKNYYLYPFRSYIVHHKDRNKRNNRVDNLEILTHEEHNKIHSKSCFIATAAYGTPFNGEIQILRNWRDEYLEKHELGNLFIKFYYWFSPSIAEIIRKNNVLRKLTRILLNPIVKYLKKFYA